MLERFMREVSCKTRECLLYLITAQSTLPRLATTVIPLPWTNRVQICKPANPGLGCFGRMDARRGVGREEFEGPS